MPGESAFPLSHFYGPAKSSGETEDLRKYLTQFRREIGFRLAEKHLIQNWPLTTLIEIANFHGKTVFDVAMSKLGVLMSWWPFKASKYLGKISKAKKGHSKVSKGQIKIDHHSLYMCMVGSLYVCVFQFKEHRYI